MRNESRYGRGKEQGRHHRHTASTASLRLGGILAGCSQAAENQIAKVRCHPIFGGLAVFGSRFRVRTSRKNRFTFYRRLHHIQAHSCGNKAHGRIRLQPSAKQFCKPMLATLAGALFSATAFCQTATINFEPEEPSAPEAPTTVAKLENPNSVQIGRAHV